MRRICTTVDGQGAEEESNANTHLRARYTTPFRGLGASRGSSRYCRAPQIRSTWPLSPYRPGSIASWGSVSSSPAGRVVSGIRCMWLAAAAQPHGGALPLDQSELRCYYQLDFPRPATFRSPAGQCTSSPVWRVVRHAGRDADHLLRREAGGQRLRHLYSAEPARVFLNNFDLLNLLALSSLFRGCLRCSACWRPPWPARRTRPLWPARQARS